MTAITWQRLLRLAVTLLLTLIFVLFIFDIYADRAGKSTVQQEKSGDTQEVTRNLFEDQSRLDVIKSEELLVQETLEADLADKANSSTEIVNKPGGVYKYDSLKSEIETEVLFGLSPLLLDVPFTSQAPFAQWQDPRQDYGCEEASMLMAWRYLTGEPLTPELARQEIVSMSDWELATFGDFHDSSAADTAERFKLYFKHDQVRVAYDIGLDEIKAELAAGWPVIVSVNGRKLTNPYFTPPGPLHHMLVIIGYDEATQQFITNDPGTKRGSGFRYSYNNLINALRDYPTGLNLEPEETISAMIVIDP